MNASNAGKVIRFRPFILPAAAIFSAVLALPAGAQMQGARLPPKVPGAPVISTAMAGNGQVGVAFAKPASDGGAPITQYIASCHAGGATRGVATGMASPLTVTGLANGTAVTCRVAARNSVGVGVASADSNSVTPAAPAGPLHSKPGAPVIGTATAGDGKVTVAFTPPASDGGSPIAQYIASCNIPGATKGVSAGTSSPLTVTGLANGTAVTCRVGARNAVGFGPTSADSNSVTPAAPAAAAPSKPGAPVIGTAIASDAQVRVNFTAPGSDGGAPISSYTAVCNDKTATGTGSPTAMAGSTPGTSKSLSVTGLTNGMTYNCHVSATNSAGTGPASAMSNPVVPAAAPSGSGGRGGAGAVRNDAPASGG